MVEDDHLVSEMVRGILEELGHGIAGEAEDGHEALDMVRELRPDVVLMDIRMPRMSGIEASLLIQKHFPTPVVILSAYETEDLVSEAFEAGVGAYVVKPPDPEELSRAMELAMDRFRDMQRIRELEGQLASMRDRIRRISSFLPLCPLCGERRTEGDYWKRLGDYLAGLEKSEMEPILCGKCRSSSATGK